MVLLRFTIMLGFLQIVCSGVPEILDYNPLKDFGYKPKTAWMHFSPGNEISASVADFTSSWCVRVVLFTAMGLPMEFVEVSCDSPKPFLGLMYIDNALWYYGSALVKKIDVVENEETGDRETKFIVVKVNEDFITCKKTYWIVKENLKQPGTIYRGGQEEVRSDVPDGDFDCRNLIQLNIPPMIMLSSHGEVGNFQSKGSSSYYNIWEPVGAKTKMYMEGLECFRLLTFYSFGRRVYSMKMACGPLQGVVMAEKAFYYGKTAMIKLHDEDPDTFTVFMNPFNGKRKSTKADIINRPTCVKKTIKLIKKKERYIKKTISILVEFELSPECKDFVGGIFPGKKVEDQRINELVHSLENNRLNVVPEILDKLEGYKLNSNRSDFNLANELGAMILFFEGQSSTDKLEVIIVVAKGTVLTGTVIKPGSTRTNLVIRGDTLYHSTNIMVRKVAEDMYSVLVNNGGRKCTSSTYELKTSNDKRLKDEKERKELDENDPVCKNFLTGTELKNPNAYNPKDDSENVS